MKQFLYPMLAVMLCFMLCACGGGQETPTEPTAPEQETVLTKEEMADQSAQVNVSAIDNASYENLDLAKMNYCDRVLELTGQISEIWEDHLVLGAGSCVVDVYLSPEDMLTLQLNQQVTVLGQMNRQVETDDEDVLHYVMPTAYFSTDRYEIPCVVQPTGVKLIGPDGTPLNGIRTVYWAEGVDWEQYDGQEVTISAKMIFNYSFAKWEYFDATIVE